MDYVPAFYGIKEDATTTMTALSGSTPAQLLAISQKIADIAKIYSGVYVRLTDEQVKQEYISFILKLHAQMLVHTLANAIFPFQVHILL